MTTPEIVSQRRHLPDEVVGDLAGVELVAGVCRAVPSARLLRWRWRGAGARGSAPHLDPAGRFFDAEPARIETGPAGALPVELGLREQRDHRLGEEEDDEQVGGGRQTEREREALDVTDRTPVQDAGCQQRHEVGGQDRAPGTRPGLLDRGAQRVALAHFVPQPFEEHDERVGGDTHGHDQAGDTGQDSV